jgi:hypothetical protein
MSILWTIIIGFVAGVIAKFLYPGNKYEPTGFILTTGCRPECGWNLVAGSPIT